MAVEASEMSGKRIHLERRENVTILETLQETTGDVERDADPEVDRWYRWIVVACFYEVDDARGNCETLDVRVRTAWNSGVPPTRWPVEVKSLGSSGGHPTSDMILLQ